MTTEEDMMRLMTQVRHLEEANIFEAGRANRMATELAEVKAKYQTLLISIYSACAGTGCVNAHELREQLDVLKAEVMASRACRDLHERGCNHGKAWAEACKARIKAQDATDAAKSLEES